MKKSFYILIMLAMVAAIPAFADSVTITPGQSATFNYTSVYNSTSKATATISLLAAGAPLPGWVVPPNGSTVATSGTWIKVSLTNKSTDYTSGCATPGLSCYVSSTGTRIDEFGFNSTPNMAGLVTNVYFGTTCSNQNQNGCSGWAVSWSVTQNGGSLSHLEYRFGDSPSNPIKDLTHGETGVAYIKLAHAITSLTLDQNGPIGGSTSSIGNNGNTCDGIGGITDLNPQNACKSISAVHMKNINNTGQSDKPGGINEVPEPASLALLGSGLIGAASMFRRKRIL